MTDLFVNDTLMRKNLFKNQIINLNGLKPNTDYSVVLKDGGKTIDSKSFMTKGDLYLVEARDANPSRNVALGTNMTYHLDGKVHRDSDYSYINGWYVTNQTSLPKATGNVTVSFDIKPTGNTAVPDKVSIGFCLPNNAAHNMQADYPVTNGHVEAQINLNQFNDNWTSVIIYSANNGWTGSVHKTADIYNLKIERATKATAWTPAPEDFATTTSYVVCQVIEPTSGSWQYKPSSLANSLWLMASGDFHIVGDQLNKKDFYNAQQMTVVDSTAPLVDLASAQTNAFDIPLGATAVLSGIQFNNQSFGDINLEVIS
ncbi:MAG: hypothetical protein J6573_07535 [Lactobacillus sp.]|nr:hypothetical protein [Lactobacillus sp.]